MTRIALAFAILAAFASAGHAQYKDILGRGPAGSSNADIRMITIRGYLVDKKCAYHAIDMQAIGPTHTTKCALESGDLGVIQRGVFYPFDEKGTKKAGELLKKTKLTQGVMVQVSGNMQDDAFVVSSLKEIKHDD